MNKKKRIIPAWGGSCSFLVSVRRLETPSLPDVKLSVNDKVIFSEVALSHSVSSPERVKISRKWQDKDMKDRMEDFQVSDPTNKCLWAFFKAHLSHYSLFGMILKHKYLLT